MRSWVGAFYVVDQTEDAGDGSGQVLNPDALYRGRNDAAPNLPPEALLGPCCVTQRGRLEQPAGLIQKETQGHLIIAACLMIRNETKTFFPFVNVRRQSKYDTIQNDIQNLCVLCQNES